MTTRAKYKSKNNILVNTFKVSKQAKINVKIVAVRYKPTSLNIAYFSS